MAAATLALVVTASAVPARADTYARGDVVVASDSTWSYWRSPSKPSTTWAATDFDDGDWRTGRAPFGYGSRLSADHFRTRLADLPDQTRTTYFRHAFDLDLSDGVPVLQFRTWADDGVVVFVNGVEIGRHRVASGRSGIPHTWVWAADAPRTSAALGENLTFQIPTEILRDGSNVIAAAVLPNWRTSFDVTFGGEVTVIGVEGDAPPPVPPAPGRPNDSVLPAGDLVAPEQRWEYRRDERGPAPAWKYDAASMGWREGMAPFGAGRAAAVTTRLSNASQPLSTYFRHVFRLERTALALDVGATVTTWADDGVVVYVNGHEVGRHRVEWDVAGSHTETWATAAPHSKVAQAELVRFAIPATYLQEGDNVIAVQVVANHHRTPDLSFDAAVQTGLQDVVAREVQTPQSDWKLVWSDEFDGTSLDRTNWTAYDNSAYGDGNLESACLMDRPENLSVHDGHLYLTARYEPRPVQCGWNDTRYPQGRSYTSAQILSRDKMTFTYGRIEIRAKLPVQQGASQGMWPAFWLRTTEGLGEIDILEALGSGSGDDWQAGVVYHSLHRETTNTLVSERSSYELPMGADMSEDFHTFALEWEEDELRFFVDDVMTARYTVAEVPWIADAFTGREFFVRLNLAVGGTWPGYVDSSTRLPASYVIDYVRLYQEQ